MTGNAIRTNGVIPELNLFSFWVADPAFGIHPSQRGFNADPDGDQLAHGIEAWFGTDPGTFSPGLAGVSTDGTVTTFTHPINLDPPSDLSASYEWSLNLADWHAGDGGAGPVGGPTVSILATPAGPIANITATATASEALEILFLRVRVDQD